MRKEETEMYNKFFKRFFDVFFATLFLIVASPIMLITAILIRIKLGSPIVFVQERVGYQEKIFKLYKFRTMSDKRDSEGKLLPDKERQTKFGRILRKTSLDELPELINIIKGDMSFIGPRPLLVAYLPLYNAEQHKRHNVRPGFTCIAAVKGRNIVPWVERFKMDTHYAENVSLKLDIWIAVNTVLVVLMKKGAPDAAESNRVPIVEALKNQENKPNED